MIDLSQRSNEIELMDGNDISYDAMAQTLKELNVVNSRLGGHAITIEGFKKLNGNSSALTVCEIGCGGGDNLFTIYKYCEKKNIEVKFIGIDMNHECIAFAKTQYPDLNCQWICKDYKAVNFEFNKPDIIFSSLFCHHFTNEELNGMLQWLLHNSERGFFINDLQRHWLAYYLIKYITRFFSKSYLVKNDAALSVARSFRKKDWEQLLQIAGIQNYSINWQWAFRYLVTIKK